MTDIVERWCERVRRKSRGRTRYEGQEPYEDEAVLAEIEHLRRENAELREKVKHCEWNARETRTRSACGRRC